MAVLNQSEVEQIHTAAVKVLATTGVKVQHQGLGRRAARAGAEVNEASGLIRFPGPLLQELIGQAPRSYALGGPGGFRCTVGTGTPQCLAIVTDPWILDYETGGLRHPCLADVRRHTRIAQSLDEVAAVSLMDYPVTDVEDELSNLYALEAHLLNHAKHSYVLAASRASLERYLRIGELLARDETPGGPPLMTAGVAVKSPLTLTEMNGDLLELACEHGLPVVPTVCPMAGTTGPYSKAGILLLAHAENLFMAALTQMVRPGHAFLYAQGPSVTDLRSGEDLYYTMDKVLWKVAGVQLGAACNLPTTAECGGTMSCRYDPQAGAEGMLFMDAAYSSGADVLAGIGSCCNAVGMSGEHMVLQTAWLAAARYLGQGIRLEGRLGLESIARVGPGGQFMDDPLTLELLRSDEFYRNGLMPYGGGEADMLTRARGRADELASGEASPLPGAAQERLRRFFRDVCGLHPA